MTTQFFILYLIAVPMFFLFDMLWLGVVARSFYQNRLASLLGPVRWGVAITFYLVFLAGLTYFAIYPAVVNNSISAALILGGLFGFFTYATYDLTNLSTLRDWPVSVTVVDMLWGTVLGLLVSVSTFVVYTEFLL